MLCFITVKLIDWDNFWKIEKEATFSVNFHSFQMEMKLSVVDIP